MTASLLERFRQTCLHSPFLATVAQVRADGGRRFVLGECTLRKLEPAEIEGLESADCTALDWSGVLVADGFDWKRVQRVRFLGKVVLGRFQATTEVSADSEQPTGVYDATLSHCIIGHDALVERVALLTRAVVGPRVVLWNCGRIVGTTLTAYGSDGLIRVGPQVNGRPIPLFAEIDLPTATQLATSQDPNLLDAFEVLRADYCDKARFDRTLICADARLLQVEHVANTFVGPGSIVDRCGLISESTLLGSEEEPVKITGAATIENAILQWGSRVEFGATVRNSVVSEYACVEDQGSLRDSVLGPNSVIGRGEVGASLLGPFVALHHQSMLISTVWPEGKGNISSGANVGANHTGRAPDQEFWPGEGMFVGLGVNVRFPADFTLAPYSVLACSVTTSPQRVEFPFSLINSPTHSFPHLSPTLNQIIPAWLLTDSLYTLMRNEQKFQQRNQARRLAIDVRVFRPEVFDLMRESCRRLEAVDAHKAVYTESDIPGLGKNYLLEAVRCAALRGYRWFLRLDGLRRLQQRVAELLAQDRSRARAALRENSNDAVWEAQRRWLAEKERLSDVPTALSELTGMLDQFGRDVERSKAKDDQRGLHIREDYALVHRAASNDPVVDATWAEIRREKAVVEKIRQQVISA